MTRLSVTLLTFLALAMPAFGEEIELLDGSTIHGTVIEVTEHGAIVLEEASGSRIIVPLSYLSLPTHFRVLERFEATLFRGEDPSLPLARWGLIHLPYEAGLRPLIESKLTEALQKGTPRELIDKMTLAFDLWLDEEGRLVHPSKGGYVKDGEGWRKAGTSGRDTARDREDLKSKFLVPKPMAYQLYTTDLAHASRSLLHGKRVRFYSYFLSTEAGFAAVKTLDGKTLSKTKYVKVLLRHDDLPRAYAARNAKRLQEKLGLFGRGEFVLVLGRLGNTKEGFLLILHDIVLA